MACNSCIPYVVSIYAFLLVVAVCVLLCFNINMSSRGASLEGSVQAAGEGGMSWLTSMMMAMLDRVCFPIGQSLIGILYGLYRRLTWFNVIVFVLKYVPTGLYTYKTLKSLYLTSRERIKEKQIELDDIQLQIQIVDTKLCVRDAEFSERTEELRRNAEQLRCLRARVRDMIAADDALRRALRHASEMSPASDQPEEDPATLLAHEEEREFILTLLKELKGGGEQFAMPEMDKLEHLDHGAQSAGDDEPNTDNSVYSSLSDADSKQEYRVKIIKVTNVYKVACLKHYIKQKRIRRATQQAILKKKIESIKKLLESWQKSLNAVIYNKLSLDPASIDMASQEAMGDYSKPNLREFSDSDSELKTSGTDVCYDEYNFNWSQNSYYNVENTEPIESKEIFEASEYHHSQEMSYPHTHNMVPHNMVHAPMCECNTGGAGGGGGNVLFILPEETSSQVAIEEIDSNSKVALPQTDC